MKNQITLVVAVIAVMVELAVVVAIPNLTNNAIAGGDHHYDHPPSPSLTSIIGLEDKS